MAAVDISKARTERYWRVAEPSQRVLYSWLTGEEPPAADPRPRSRRSSYRKTAVKRPRKPVKRAA